MFQQNAKYTLSGGYVWKIIFKPNIFFKMNFLSQ